MSTFSIAARLHLGLPEDTYYYGNDYVAVRDVSAPSDNVLVDDTGKLLFIDPVIKLNKPIDDIIVAYPFTSQHASQKHNLLERIKGWLNRFSD